jgi:oligopeptide transport system ATP-binding protein
MKTPENIFVIKDLVKHFPVTGGVFSRVLGQVRAVDGISFDIRRGETLGIVGESGSGKSTLGRVLLRLLEPTGGEAYFLGQNVFKMPAEEFRLLRRNMQIVFQDPFASLNPRMTVGEIVGEPLEIHGIARGKEKEIRVKELLEVVGLSAEHIRRYPHMFSGGQRQRIGVARALALNPKFVILDEPVSALDVSIQSQIINLLEDLQGEFDLTYLFIAHDLSVIRHISDRVAVMYLGKMVEIAPVDRIFDTPSHPYTNALLSAIPVLDTDVETERIVLTGDIPSPMQVPPGCRFHTRCPHRMDICSIQEPESRSIGTQHFVSCHLTAPGQ